MVNNTFSYEWYKNVNLLCALSETFQEVFQRREQPLKKVAKLKAHTLGKTEHFLYYSAENLKDRVHR